MSKKRGTQHIRKRDKLKKKFTGYRERRVDNKVGKRLRHKKAILARRVSVAQRIKARKS